MTREQWERAESAFVWLALAVLFLSSSVDYQHIDALEQQVKALQTQQSAQAEERQSDGN